MVLCVFCITVYWGGIGAHLGRSILAGSMFTTDRNKKALNKQGFDVEE